MQNTQTGIVKRLAKFVYLAFKKRESMLWLIKNENISLYGTSIKSFNVNNVGSQCCFLGMFYYSYRLDRCFKTS